MSPPSPGHIEVKHLQQSDPDMERHEPAGARERTCYGLQ